MRRALNNGPTSPVGGALLARWTDLGGPVHSRSGSGKVREDGAMRQLAVVGAMCLVACYPGGAETLTDFDSVTTERDAAANFASLHTYALPDSIMELPPAHGTQLPLDHSYDAEILGRVASNLDKLGWTRVDPTTTTADVDVLVSVTLGQYVNFVSYDYYSGYPGWPGFDDYGPSWGVGYSWAGGGYVQVIDAGSLRVDMLDARNPDTSTQQLNALWAATFRGLLASTDSNLQRINQAIDQAFAQSPYL